MPVFFFFILMKGLAMNKALFVLVSTLIAGTAFAAGTTASAPAGTEQPTARQLKMVTCGKLAKGKKGKEHKAFMKDCMAKQDEAKPAPSPAPEEHQEKK